MIGRIIDKHIHISRFLFNFPEALLHLFRHRDVADFHKGPAALFPDFLCNRLQLASGPSY